MFTPAVQLPASKPVQEVLHATDANRMPERSRSIPPSSLHQIHRLTQQRAAATIPLHVGEPYLSIPESVREAFIRAIRDSHSYYCDAPGLPALRSALSQYLEERTGAPVSVDRLFVTPGSCQAIAAILMSVAFDGGTALLPEVHWPIHLQQVLLAGLKPRFYRTMESGKGIAEALNRAYTAGACVLIFNSPANPSGRVADPATITEVYEWAQQRGICIISDDAYEDFIYEGQPSCMSMLDDSNAERNRIVFSVHTFSKSYAMTGYRLGYVAAPNDERAGLLQRVQEAMLVSPSTPVQFAGLAALAERSFLRRHHDYVRATRDQLVKMLSSSGLLWAVPKGGWYALLDLSKYSNDTDTFCLQLLDEAGVALAPASPFFPAGHPLGHKLARIAFCGERASVLKGLRLLLELH